MRMQTIQLITKNDNRFEMKSPPAVSQKTRIRRKAFDRALRALSFMRSFSTYQRSAEKRCETISDIAYHTGGNPSHRLDLYRPRSIDSPLPVVLYIHGGGFTICSKQTHRGITLAYADRGYVAVNIDYRLAPRHPFPAALEDAGRAWKWVVENIENFGGDPNRIVIAGESAGGNLTLALAACACFRRPEPFAQAIFDAGVAPRAIMVICGYLQVSDPFRLKRLSPPMNPYFRQLSYSVARDVSRAYLGQAYKSPHPDSQLADPLLVLESNDPEIRPFPAVYAMSGTRDILLSDTRRLEQALKNRQIRHTVRYFPNEGHAFHLLGLSRQTLAFWRENLEFLETETAPELKGG